MCYDPLRFYLRFLICFHHLITDPRVFQDCILLVPPFSELLFDYSGARKVGSLWRDEPTSLSAACLQHVGSPFAACPAHLRSLFATCLQPVRAGCLQLVRTLRAACLAHLRSLFAACLQPVRSMSAACLQPGRGMFKACPAHLHSLFAACLQPVCNMCAACRSVAYLPKSSCACRTARFSPR